MNRGNPQGKGADPFRCLVADIGGTHARYAVVERDRGTGAYQVIGAMKLETGAFGGMQECLDAFLGAVPGPRPEMAGIAVAGPTEGDHVRLTNLNWEFSVSGLKKHFGLSRLKVVNDFAAFLMGVTILDREHVRQVKAGVPRQNCAVAAVGPGTGLGIASIVPGARGWTVAPGEGGHCGFAPGNAQELEIAAALMGRFGRVTLEDVLSGPGMRNIHAALLEIEGKPPGSPSPEEITRLGLARQDPLCVETLQVYCGMLGSAVGDVALMTGARGGVYLGGGVLRKFDDLLADGYFARRFQDKGVMSAYLADIPVYSVHGGNCSLRGAALLLEQEDAGRPATPLKFLSPAVSNGGVS